MIKFQTEPRPVWVSGDHEAFDMTELRHWPSEERAKVRFLITPSTPTLAKNLKEKYGKGIDLKNFNPANPASMGENNSDLQNAIIDALVTKWVGVYDEEGNELPCTVENKIKLFDGGYPLLGQRISLIALELMSRISYYEAEAEEEEIKN